MEYADFEKEMVVRKAVERDLITIGEAARRLPVDFRSAHSDLPWDKIIGLRNVLTHEYDRVDGHRLWNLISGELPLLREQLVTILKSLDL